MKETEILARRVEIMESLREYTGRYVSNEYILKNILRMTDEDIESERKKIVNEMDDEIYKDPAFNIEEL